MVVYLIEDVGDLDERLLPEIRKRWHTGKKKKKKKKRIRDETSEITVRQMMAGGVDRMRSISVHMVSVPSITIYSIKYDIFSTVVNNGSVARFQFPVQNKQADPLARVCLEGGPNRVPAVIRMRSNVQHQQQQQHQTLVKVLGLGSLTKKPGATNKLLFFLPLSNNRTNKMEAENQHTHRHKQN